MGNCCQSGQGHTSPAESLQVLPAPQQVSPESQKVLPEAPPARQEKIDHPLYTKWESYVAPEVQVKGKTWTSLEGTKLEPLLDHLDLVDLAFIVENTEAGLPVPRCQDVPTGARINKSNLNRIKNSLNSYALSVVAISYPWLDPQHPDKSAVTMQRCLKCFKAFLEGASKIGEGCTVGLMMDYPCLPQKRTDGVDDRTPEEKARFKKALGTINQWYMHPYATTLVYDVELPEADSGHSNLRPYINRGWCTFEFRASCLVKAMFCLWSLKGYEKAGSAISWAAGVQGGKSALLRAAPMTPPKFDETLRAGVANGEIAFTAKADLDFVINQYAAAFDTAFSETKDLMYQALKWPDEHICELAEALTYARENGLLQKTGTLRIWGNAWTDVGNKAVKKAIEGMTITLFDT
mmetsp:Transcript_50454/g.134926  ORF Transcript_50454/g.134926 Transcript_50454/m.134926 type:complete len:407 (-) Transcript_50454:318-1538(-)